MQRVGENTITWCTRLVLCSVVLQIRAHRIWPSQQATFPYYRPLHPIPGPSRVGSAMPGVFDLMFPFYAFSVVRDFAIQNFL